MRTGRRWVILVKLPLGLGLGSRANSLVADCPTRVTLPSKRRPGRASTVIITLFPGRKKRMSVSLTFASTRTRSGSCTISRRWPGVTYSPLSTNTRSTTPSNGMAMVRSSRSSSAWAFCARSRCSSGPSSASWVRSTVSSPRAASASARAARAFSRSAWALNVCCFAVSSAARVWSRRARLMAPLGASFSARSFSCLARSSCAAAAANLASAALTAACLAVMRLCV